MLMLALSPPLLSSRTARGGIDRALPQRLILHPRAGQAGSIPRTARGDARVVLSNSRMTPRRGLSTGGIRDRVDRSGAELDADAKVGVRHLGHRVLPRLLARPAHDDEVAAAEVEGARAPAAHWTYEEEPPR